MATCSSVDSVLEAAIQIKSNATKLNTFVNGTASQTVQLGTGDPTPTLRKFVADAQDVVTQAALDAGQTVLDDVAQNAQDIAELQSGKADKCVPADYGNLAKLNAEGNLLDAGCSAEDFVRLLSYAGTEACAVSQRLQSMITEHDEETARTNLMTRMFNGTNPVAGSKPVLFIAAGQSNAEGSCDQSIYETAEHAGTYWAWNRSPKVLLPLKDPVFSAFGGSAWPEFGRMFFSLTGRQVMMLNVGFGTSVVTDLSNEPEGTGRRTWYASDPNTLRTRAKEQYDDLVAYCTANGIDYDIGGVLWIQGESDAARLYEGSIDIQDYIDGTIDVFSWFRNTVTSVSNLPILISKTGSSIWWETVPDRALCARKIRNAQDVICAASENNYMAYTLAIDFVANRYTSDNSLHYSQIGYNLVADAFARQAVHILSL